PASPTGGRCRLGPPHPVHWQPAAVVASPSLRLLYHLQTHVDFAPGLDRRRTQTSRGAGTAPLSPVAHYSPRGRGDHRRPAARQFRLQRLPRTGQRPGGGRGGARGARAAWVGEWGESFGEWL